MVPVVLVLILRGNKSNSLSTSVPTDTNQAYGVTKQNDMDVMMNIYTVIRKWCLIMKLKLNQIKLTPQPSVQKEMWPIIQRTRLFKKRRHMLQMLSLRNK